VTHSWRGYQARAACPKIPLARWFQIRPAFCPPAWKTRHRIAEMECGGVHPWVLLASAFRLSILPSAQDADGFLGQEACTEPGKRLCSHCHTGHTWVASCCGLGMCGACRPGRGRKKACGLAATIQNRYRADRREDYCQEPKARHVRTCNALPLMPRLWRWS